MAEVNTLPPIPPGIALITGPTIVGIVLNWMFMGFIIPQTYYYNIHFPKDPLKIKALVLLDALQSAMVLADAFHWFVYGFGDMNRLDEAFLNAWDVPFLDALIAVIVQSFYCWRIWMLRHSYILPIIILLVSFTGFGAGLAVAIHAQQLEKLSRIGANLKQQTTWLVASALADVLITVVLSWTLLSARSKSKELPASRTMISRIVRMTVETNSLTAGIAIVALVIYLAVPDHTTLVVPPTAIIGKLYTNCLIAVLNHRTPQAYSGGHGGSTSSMKYSTGYSHSYNPDSTPVTPNSAQYPQVKVDILTQMNREDDIALEDVSRVIPRHSAEETE